MFITTMFWNTQGAASPSFRRSFFTMVQNYKPSLVVLLEPRISGYKADNFIKRSGFDNSYRVEAEGFAGGIWVLWKDFLQVEVVASHSQYVHLQISNNHSFLSWLTTIYASPHPNIRKHLWGELDKLAQTVYGPWIMGGDFNTILYDSEKKKEAPLQAWELTIFSTLGSIFIACMIFNSTGLVLLGPVEAFSNALTESFAIVNGFVSFLTPLYFIFQN